MQMQILLIVNVGDLLYILHSSFMHKRILIEVSVFFKQVTYIVISKPIIACSNHFLLGWHNLNMALKFKVPFILRTLTMTCCF